MQLSIKLHMVEGLVGTSISQIQINAMIFIHKVFFLVADHTNCKAVPVLSID